jgi:hypothetical protein
MQIFNRKNVISRVPDGLLLRHSIRLQTADPLYSEDHLSKPTRPVIEINAEGDVIFETGSYHYLQFISVSLLKL